MTIGSHGWNHVDLRTLAESELSRETRDSQSRISGACGSAVTSFAVPLGSYDRRVLRHLGAYATVYTSDATSVGRRTWIVPRWSYVRGWTGESVTHHLESGGSPWHVIRQRAAMVAKRWR